MFLKVLRLTHLNKNKDFFSNEKITRKKKYSRSYAWTILTYDMFVCRLCKNNPVQERNEYL